MGQRGERAEMELGFLDFRFHYMGSGAAVCRGESLGLFPRGVLQPATPPSLCDTLPPCLLQLPWLTLAVCAAWEGHLVNPTALLLKQTPGNDNMSTSGPWAPRQDPTAAAGEHRSVPAAPSHAH